MRLKISRLTRNSIKPYGYLIDQKIAKDQPDGNGWGILLRSKAQGWRIAYLILRSRAITRLEKHPDSLEVFDPVKGKAVMALAPAKAPEKFKLFYLDKPVALKKSVWHGLASISKETHIKIFENSSVKCIYQKIEKTR